MNKAGLRLGLFLFYGFRGDDRKHRPGGFAVPGLAVHMGRPAVLVAMLVAMAVAMLVIMVMMAPALAAAVTHGDSSV